MPPDRAPVGHERADTRASHAAHDLHDSFTVIKTAVQVLHRQARLQRLTSEGLLTRLEVIEATAMRMSLLVREMLDSARMAQGAPPLLECRPSDLRALAERRDLRLETTERAVIGLCDGRRLGRALQNFVGTRTARGAGRSAWGSARRRMATACGRW